MLIQRISQPSDTQLQLIPASSPIWFEAAQKVRVACLRCATEAAWQARLLKLSMQSSFSGDFGFFRQSWTPLQEVKH